jgi:hypothetical protein
MGPIDHVREMAEPAMTRRRQEKEWLGSRSAGRSPRRHALGESECSGETAEPSLETVEPVVPSLLCARTLGRNRECTVLELD